MANREDTARTLIDARSHGGRCELCHRLGNEVHHRNKQGRVWVASNLLRLCRTCHHWLEHHPTYAMELGLWVPREWSPADQPVYCWPLAFRPGWWLPDDEGMWHFADSPGCSDAAMEALQQHLATRRALT